MHHRIYLRLGFVVFLPVFFTVFFTGFFAGFLPVFLAGRLGLPPVTASTMMSVVAGILLGGFFKLKNIPKTPSSLEAFCGDLVNFSDDAYLVKQFLGCEFFIF